jgi:CRISPR-associated endonuclease/helicase Cas3
MDPNNLWAKSKWRDEPMSRSMLLPNHLAEVHEAAGKLLDASGDDQLGALGLMPNAVGDRFRRCVLLAAATHDLGKANDHFQGMICGKRDVRQNPQGLRHEWVSVLLLREKLRDWLLPAVGGNEVDFAIVEWAVGGHHPAYGRECPPRRKDPQGEGDRLTVLTFHPEFRDCLQVLKDRFPVADVPKFTESWILPLVGPRVVFDQIHKWFLESRRLWGHFTDQERRLVAAIKVALIGADVAGSALPREVTNETMRASWIGDAFANTPQPGDLAAIVSRRLDGATLRDFQANVAAAKASITFAKAGCGSGKTIAAYHWAATNHPTKRLYFCYPTTGTATEGFRDYLHVPESEKEAGDSETVRAIKARLFHGRAEIDMELIVQDDEPSAEADAVARIESLEAWSTPVVSCTVDTVLGLVQNIRRGIYAWPALAGAAFVFDEIHAYDDKLFGAILRFLQNLPGVPVLLMTASLPKARLIALHDCLRRAEREPIVEIAGPEGLEIIPRYHREETPADVAQRVRDEIGAAGKVLWVSNTVNRAMAAADSIADLNPAIYHSRFRYCDRVQRHEAVVKAFKAEQREPIVACTTQVCEMSLDLEGVTLLVTEEAPVPAIIQRLGRLNRRAKAGDRTRPFIVIEIGSDCLPYPEKELKSARGWLTDLPKGSLSQRDLSNAWEQYDTGTKPDFVESAWLNGGPRTEVRELREASWGITVVLHEDASAVRSKTKRLAEVALPMPKPPAEWRGWSRLNGLPIAPPSSIEYNPLRGAKWKNA